MTCVRATAWHCHDDNRLYLLAGQHIVKAIAKIRADRESKGLQLEKWHRLVQVDVLKHETPLDVRKLVAGASNASTRFQRNTTVTECLASILKLEENPSLTINDKILLAVEQCGLNITGASPVCIDQLSVICHELRARSSC